MMMKLRDFRRIVSEVLTPVRRPAIVTLDQLTSMQEELDEMLASGELSLADYEHEWMETLQSLGWTPDMYEREVDRRWDYVGSDRDVLVAPRTYGAN